MRSPIVALLGAIITFAVGAPAATVGAAPHCAVTRDRDGALSASVVDTPLDQVLLELARETGLTIAWAVRPTADPTTVTFAGLPLTDAIARLLPGRNYVLVFKVDAAGTPHAERLLVSLPSQVSPPATIADRRRTVREDSETAEGVAVDEDDRIQLGIVRSLVDVEPPRASGFRLGESLARALAVGDADDVRRATMLGLAALADETLEETARTNDGLRSSALDVLATRAEQEQAPRAALTRLANDGDDPTLALAVTRTLDDRAEMRR